MREIKFRAWDTVEKKMKLPTLLRLSRDLPYTDDNNNGKVFQMQCNGQENVEYFNGRIELMQYTGLKDKNGKEIYEGDIIEYKSIYEWEKQPIKKAEVVFEDGMFCPPGVIMDLSRSEIIGNIYENPELLEKEGVK